MDLIRKQTACFMMNTYIILADIDLTVWIEALYLLIVREKLLFIRNEGIPDEVQTPLFSIPFKDLIFECPFNRETPFFARTLFMWYRSIVYIHLSVEIFKISILGCSWLQCLISIEIDSRFQSIDLILEFPS